MHVDWSGGLEGFIRAQPEEVRSALFKRCCPSETDTADAPSEEACIVQYLHFLANKEEDHGKTEFSCVPIEGHKEGGEVLEEVPTASGQEEMNVLGEPQRKRARTQELL